MVVGWLYLDSLEFAQSTEHVELPVELKNNRGGLIISAEIFGLSN